MSRLNDSLGLVALAVVGCSARNPRPSDSPTNRVASKATTSEWAPRPRYDRPSYLAPSSHRDRDPWTAVTASSYFTFDNWHDTMYPANVAVVRARVKRVDRTPTSRTIHLEWTVDWGGAGPIDLDLSAANRRETAWLPARVIVSASMVRFDDRDMEFPLTAANFPDGRYVAIDGDVTCFGFDRSEIRDCDESCAGKICLDPRAGIVGGDGEGWPNNESFVRPELAR